MSWFTRSFSLKEEDEERRMPPGRREGYDDAKEEEEESDSLNLAEIASATGASVKEDLSNLRKTFTRQLWGVASFLAPPPQERSSADKRGAAEEEHQAVPQQQQQQGDDGEVRGSSGAASLIESEREREGFVPDNGSPHSGDALAPDVSYPQETTGSFRNSNATGETNEALAASTQGLARPKLTGLRSDFAELRGTVATGISRITSVLREVTRDDDSGGEYDDEEELALVSSRENPQPVSSLASEERQGLNSPRRGFDAFLKPLFGNMLMRETASSGDEPTSQEDVNPAADETTEMIAYYAKESPGKGEPRYRELESLPSAIASGIGGISKFASSLLQIVSDEMDGYDEDEEKEDELGDRDLPVGLTEPVVTFARNIAMHPETWLDFPLTEDDVDEDFELTNAQQAHIRGLEVAAPGLEALKIELCPNYMTEGRFWKIYFVLMHSRLRSNEALMLSNQQVVRARASMLQEMLRKELQTNDPHQEYPIDEKVESGAFEHSQQDSKQTDQELGSRLPCQPTHPRSNSSPADSTSFEDIRLTGEASKGDRSMIVSRDEMGSIPADQDIARLSMLHLEDETEVDEWPDEEASTNKHDIDNSHSHLNTSNMDDEDVSFSDLEEDDSLDKIASTSKEISASTPKSPVSVVLDGAPTTPFVGRETSSPSTQGDGTPRKSSERGEFNDWFKVDQDDVASAGSTSP